MSDFANAEQYANVALSVWSNTCNAYCLEEDRTHAPACLLAAGLYHDLTGLSTNTLQRWKREAGR